MSNSKLLTLENPEQKRWLEQFIHSDDIEQTYQVLYQSLIMEHEVIQNAAKSVYEKEMLKTQSLMHDMDMNAEEKQQFLKETHELFLTSQKSIGVDEQSAKIKLEQRIMALNNVKNLAVNEKKQAKTKHMMIGIISLIILGFYVVIFF